MHEFSGAAGFCRIWVPRFSAIARPLYDLLGGQDREPLTWTEEARAAFTEIKLALGRAPALDLLDIERPFSLFIHEKDKIALGVLTQSMGPWHRLVAHLSKKLDLMVSGWPPCLRALAATVLLIKEADKLTLGQTLNVKVPHAVVSPHKCSRISFPLQFSADTIPRPSL